LHDASASVAYSATLAQKPKTDSPTRKWTERKASISGLWVSMNHPFHRNPPKSTPYSLERGRWKEVETHQLETKANIGTQCAKQGWRQIGGESPLRSKT